MSKRNSYLTQDVISYILATRSDSEMSDLSEDSNNENLASKTANDGGEIESETDESV